MLTLLSLEVVNFGPFNGSQTIHFSPDPGVTVVFGENGRGKTTLLNAFRFALFGTVKARAAQQISLFDLINIEARKAGSAFACVSLSFAQGTDNYVITRKIACRPRIIEPQSSADLVVDFWLVRNGNTLSPDDARDELERIMPEQVSRFFLFDGELLQEYEELLRNESVMGSQIKEAIERILGLPLITNSRQDLKDLHVSAQRQEAAAATKDQRVQIFQAQLQRAIASREEHERIIEQKVAERRKVDQERASIVVEMQKSEGLRKLIGERGKVETDIANLRDKTIERRLKLQENLADSWKSVLITELRAGRDNLRQRYNAMVEQRAAKHAAESMLRAFEESLSSSECATCGRRLDAESRNHAVRRADALRGDVGESVSEDLIEGTRRSLSILDRATSTPKAMLLRELAEGLEDLQIDIANKEARLSELRDLTKGAEEDEALKLVQRDRQLTEEISILDRAIKDEQSVLSNDQRQIEKIEQSLDKTGGADLARERRQRELCLRLHALFSASVDEYRSRLRDKVEAAATALFLQLTNDPDYVGLAINDNYGLTIVHRTGVQVPVRSAGNEHVVALSLMGALQQNAPLKGPIIMDSPFGRLDQVHKFNVVKALPVMADQVVLLVYESEMGPQQARNLLAGRLRKEYLMKRVSSFDTQVAVLGAD